MGYYLFIITVFSTSCLILVRAEVKSTSACFGSASSTCNTFSMKCNKGYIIRLLNMEYGAKTYKCDAERRSRCLDPNRNGCCVPKDGDCMEYYSDLHAYNLHKECSGKQSCGPMQVPRNILRSCNDALSSYVHITYECLEDSDSTTIHLCRDNNFNNLNGEAFNVFFNSAVDVFSRPSACSCFISSDGDINIDYVDVRMTRSFTTNDGSDCSSAVLSTVPNNDVDTTCDPAEVEDVNFVYSKLSETKVKDIEVKLNGIYKTGGNDAPELIWLYVNADDQSPVNIQCFKHATLPPPVTTDAHVTTDDTGSSSTSAVTGDPVDVKEDSNTGAIVAGVLVPIIILLVIGAIVAFIVWKRRGHLCNKCQKDTKPDRYTDNGGIENSVDNEEYAEIGFVPDQPQMEPYYDPVYESKNKKLGQDSCNGHGYQNVGNVDKINEKPGKRQTPLTKIKSHTTRLISFFRNQHAKDFSEGENKNKDTFEESYDHLRPPSASMDVKVNITPAVDEPRHTYSHTTDESVKRQVESNADKAVKKPGDKNKPLPKRQSDFISEQANAVHIGDAYIEFQFGEFDENHPDLVRAEEMEKRKPAPPTRPPPSPKSSPRMSPKQERSPEMLSAQINTRSKSPNFLSPDQIEPDTSRCASPHGSNSSDVSSEHSYKILEEQQLYDYAEVSDAELAEAEEQPGGIYEEVDREASVKKHRSAADVPYDQEEYLEPVTSRTRTVSSPGVLNDNKDKAGKPQQISKASMLRNELKERTKRTNQAKEKTDSDKKYVNIGNSEARKEKIKTPKDEPNTIKSDNVNTKDYQKVTEIKGVMKMAKMFETKDSDTDSSRQVRHATSPTVKSDNPSAEVYKFEQLVLYIQYNLREQHFRRADTSLERHLFNFPKVTLYRKLTFA